MVKEETILHIFMKQGRILTTDFCFSAARDRQHTRNPERRRSNIHYLIWKKDRIGNM